MKKNIGTIDRLVRLALSILSGIAALFTDSMILKVVLVLLSMFILYEALAGWCALYALLGKNTCPVSYKKGKIKKI